MKYSGYYIKSLSLSGSLAYFIIQIYLPRYRLLTHKTLTTAIYYAITLSCICIWDILTNKQVNLVWMLQVIVLVSVGNIFCVGCFFMFCGSRLYSVDPENYEVYRKKYCCIVIKHHTALVFFKVM